MVWSDRGKCGVRSGNTVRRTFGYGKAPRPNLLLRSAELSAGVTKDDLFSEWDIDDGIPAHPKTQPDRNRLYRHDDIMFSLDKKKRWQKIQDIKDWILSEKDEEAPNVVLVERLISKTTSFYNRHASHGVCVGVYDSRLGDRKPRGKISHVRDLLKPDEESKIIYEACTTSSFQLYPDHNYKPYKDLDDISGKSSVKQKGQGKLRMFGNETRQTLREACSVGNSRPQIVRTRRGKVVYRRGETWGKSSKSDCKQQIIDKKSFEKLSTCAKKNRGYCEIDLQALLDKKIYHRRSKDLCENLKEKTFRKYGKGDAIYLPEQYEEEHVHMHDPVPVEEGKVPVTWTADDNSVTINVETQSVQPDVLKSTFGHTYEESLCYPGRKFAIKLETNSETEKGKGHAHLLCESKRGDSTLNTSLQCRVLSSTFLNDNMSKALLNKLQQLGELKNAVTMGQVHDELLVQMKEGEVKCDIDTKTQKPSHKSLGTWVDGVVKSQADVLTEVEAMTVLMRGTEESDALAHGHHTNAVPCPDGQVEDQEDECGICYRERVDPDDVEFSCLKACHHLFCVQCWREYAAVSVSEGRIKIQCPAHDCKQTVDSVFLMSLLPGQAFAKFQDFKYKHLLELDDKFKWCPGNACSSVAMATCKDSCGVKCKCGLTWCFQCQDDIHWPASCSEFAEFQKLLPKHYLKLLSDKDLITSVQVKKCPNCSYPIEKNGGCPHMYCILCRTSYCWTCLTPFQFNSFIHDCKQKGHQEIKLTIDRHTNRSQFYMQEAIKNHSLRKALGNGRLALRKYCQLFSSVQSNWNDALFSSNQCLRSKSLKTVLESLDRPDRNSIVREAFIFCEQSYFLLEHFAMSLSFYRNKERSAKILSIYDDLCFMVGRVEGLIEASLPQVLRADVCKKLSMFLKAGKKFQKSIEMIAKQRAAQIEH